MQELIALRQPGGLEKLLYFTCKCRAFLRASVSLSVCHCNGYHHLKYAAVLHEICGTHVRTIFHVIPTRAANSMERLNTELGHA